MLNTIAVRTAALRLFLNGGPAVLPLTVVAGSKTGYKTASDAVRRILDLPSAPVAFVNPGHTHLVLLHADPYPPIAHLAEPMVGLAGLRINIRNGAPRESTCFRRGDLVQLKNLRKTPLAIPHGARLSEPSWNDRAMAAFLAHFADRVEIYILDTLTASGILVPRIRANAAGRVPLAWLPNGRLLTLVFPSLRECTGSDGDTEIGPYTEDSAGEAVPVVTFQDLLKSEHDERLFEYHLTSQVAMVEISTGTLTLITPPGLYFAAIPSPDGQFVLTRRVHRPFSRIFRASRFPMTLEVWSVSGQLVRTIADLPLDANVKPGRVRPGAREITWVPLTKESTLSWVETTGDLAAPDRVLVSQYPFDRPREFCRVTGRISKQPLWSSDGWLWITEIDTRARCQRTLLARDGARPVEIAVRDIQDRYSDIGVPITSGYGSGRLIRTTNGSILLAGAGASPEGDYPFLDSYDLNTGIKIRRFRSEANVYEKVVEVLEDDGSRLLTQRESPDQPGNYYLVSEGARTPVTNYTSHASDLQRITQRHIGCSRVDGVLLNATVYLPPDYTAGVSLPAVLWAYPVEYVDKTVAAQITTSRNRFSTVGGASPLFLLLHGYAVISLSIPVVGDPVAVNDTYLQQVVNGAESIVKRAAEMQYVDQTRIAVGGHSYGAAMGAMLLAHSRVFSAGIALSGAYNRTLTPFGFQRERRTLWQAPDTYLSMSPLLAANNIRAPLLLIHGAVDNNPGTDPIQSERMFAALRGNGIRARLVILPYESHGYSARESVEHIIAEMVDWLDAHLKHRSHETRKDHSNT